MVYISGGSGNSRLWCWYVEKWWVLEASWKFVVGRRVDVSWGGGCVHEEGDGLWLGSWHPHRMGLTAGRLAGGSLGAHEYTKFPIHAQYHQFV